MESARERSCLLQKLSRIRANLLRCPAQDRGPAYATAHLLVMLILILLALDTLKLPGLGAC